MEEEEGNARTCMCASPREGHKGEQSRYEEKKKRKEKDEETKDMKEGRRQTARQTTECLRK